MSSSSLFFNRRKSTTSFEMKNSRGSDRSRSISLDQRQNSFRTIPENELQEKHNMTKIQENGDPPTVVSRRRASTSYIKHAKHRKPSKMKSLFDSFLPNDPWDDIFMAFVSFLCLLSFIQSILTFVSLIL